MIRKEFQSQTFALRDGRVLSGLVVNESDHVLTLVDSSRQKLSISRDTIEDSKPADVSLMPEGMLEKLTEPQIRDLFRYLQSSGVKMRSEGLQAESRVVRRFSLAVEPLSSPPPSSDGLDAAVFREYAGRPGQINQIDGFRARRKSAGTFDSRRRPW